MPANPITASKTPNAIFARTTKTNRESALIPKAGSSMGTSVAKPKPVMVSAPRKGDPDMAA